MYYIEQGLGKAWKPMAVFFALSLGFSSFLAGNGVQANTIADVLQTQFSIPFWVSGLAGALIVGSVIIGGISRIGRVTGILAPAMASLYVAGAMVIIILHVDQLLPSLALIVTEAFNPTAGIAGTGVGVFLVTAMWGIRRGLFSNEAGLGSAPIAHAAAQTDEPVSEGVVALLGPFIDTIVICTMTALVIIMTGSWDDRLRRKSTWQAGTPASSRRCPTDRSWCLRERPQSSRSRAGSLRRAAPECPSSPGIRSLSTPCIRTPPSPSCSRVRSSRARAGRWPRTGRSIRPYSGMRSKMGRL